MKCCESTKWYSLVYVVVVLTKPSNPVGYLANGIQLSNNSSATKQSRDFLAGHDYPEGGQGANTRSGTQDLVTRSQALYQAGDWANLTHPPRQETARNNGLPGQLSR